MACIAPSNPVRTGSNAQVEDIFLSARHLGLDLSGWNADFEGARLLIRELRAEREASIIYWTGER